MKKNLIFDFGQVLIHFSPEEMTRAFVEDEKQAERICPVIYDRLYWDRLDDGTISDEELLCAACSRLPEEDHEIARYAYDHGFEACRLIEGMSELVKKCKEAGFGLYLLSNVSTHFAETYGAIPKYADLFALFDGLVFSGPLRMVKPNRTIFDHLLHSYGLFATDCLFIDDSQKNLDGAERVGIATYLFDGNAKKLEAYLFEK